MIKKLFIIINLTCLLYAQNAAEKITVNFGFYVNSILLSNEKETVLAIELWIKELMLSQEITVNLRIYDAIDVMIDDFLKDDKLQMMGFDSITYLKNKKVLMGEYQKLWTLRASKEEYIQYYLIRTTQDKEENFELKDKNIAIKKGDLSAKMWLDTLSIKNFKKPYKKLVKSEVLVDQQSSAMLRVYFQNVDCAVVTKSTFEVMKELNPSVAKKIRIVKKSPKIFVSYVGLFSKKLSKDVISVFKKSQNEINMTPKGRLILDLLKVNKVVSIKESFLNNLDEYYKNYQKLLNE